MDTAPVDFIAVRFPRTDFSPEVVDGIRSLTDSGTIRIIDLLFLVKDQAGEITIRELTDLDEIGYESWNGIVGDVFGYLTKEDATLLADSLPPDSSAVLVLVENTWAQEMVRTIAEAEGDVLISERIPRPVVQQLVMNH
jgi:uncharacterized membrane protein